MATSTADAKQAVEQISTPKKIRLNPARRRAAQKLKADGDQPRAAPTRSTTEPTLSSGTPLAFSTASSPATSVKPKPDPIPAVSRRTSEPSTSNLRPTPTRTVTAPARSTTRAGQLALTGPALVTGGLVGCAAGAAVLLGVGLWYDFAGAESALLAARAAKLCVDNLSEEIMVSLKAGTYSADEALDMLRRTTLAYASTIPEGAPFVERVFREIEMVRRQRGVEVDKVVAETYAELAKAGKRRATPAEMRGIVLTQLTKLSTFASRATQDVVARNPKLRPYREGAIRSLQPPSEGRVPTVRVNMAVRQKQVVSR